MGSMSVSSCGCCMSVSCVYPVAVLNAAFCITCSLLMLVEDAMAAHPKVLGLTLDQNLTYSTHIHNISVQAHKPLQIIKALAVTGWGKQKETLMATYKAVMRLWSMPLLYGRLLHPRPVLTNCKSCRTQH